MKTDHMGIAVSEPGDTRRDELEKSIHNLQLIINICDTDYPDERAKKRGAEMQLANRKKELAELEAKSDA